jgi:uncharacterized protein YjbI with pentapeptide repeats
MRSTPDPTSLVRQRLHRLPVPGRAVQRVGAQRRCIPELHLHPLLVLRRHVQRLQAGGSTFTDCTFGVTTVEGGDWSFVGLGGADLRGVRVTGTRMREADLSRARLERAELRDVDLSGASLQHANLAECDLRGSDLSTLDPLTVELRGAVVTYEQAVPITTSLGLDVRPS